MNRVIYGISSKPPSMIECANDGIHPVAAADPVRAVAYPVGMSGRSVRIADDVIFEVLDDEAVLLNLTTGEYYSLNRTGTRAWQLIEEHGDLDRVRAAMAAEFDVGEDALAQDLDRLVSDLRERRLLLTA